MTYTREQDMAAIIKCLKTGKPLKMALISRITKKYEYPKSVCALSLMPW